jgi:outer membrane murein-binding lipoprotein Lpp
MKRIATTVLAGLMVGVLLFAGCGSSKSEVEELNTKVAQLETEVKDLKDQLADISKLSELLDPAYIAQFQTEKSRLENEVADLKDRVDRFSKLWDPTYAEAVAFIKADSTSEMVTVDSEDTLTALVLNAAKQGIKCYWVAVRTSAIVHGGNVVFNFVGFHTGDKGWVYFRGFGTWGDEEAKLEVGKKLSELNPQLPRLGAAGLSDTIESIDYLPLGIEYALASSD